MKSKVVQFNLPYLHISAAAEIHDAMESYESKVVRLNKQLADMAVQLSSKEKDFSTERQTFKGQLEAAETRVAELSSEGEGERKKSKSQSQEYEDTILHLKQQCSELQREVEVARNAQTDSIFLQKGQNDKAADLLRESDKLRKQVCFKGVNTCTPRLLIISLYPPQQIKYLYYVQYILFLLSSFLLLRERTLTWPRRPVMLWLRRRSCRPGSVNSRQKMPPYRQRNVICSAKSRSLLHKRLQLSPSMLN